MAYAREIINLIDQLDREHPSHARISVAVVALLLVTLALMAI